MVGGTIKNQQYVLLGEPAGQHVEERLEARRGWMSA
jgi:hypothetical protein